MCPSNQPPPLYGYTLGALVIHLTLCCSPTHSTFDPKASILVCTQGSGPHHHRGKQNPISAFSHHRRLEQLVLLTNSCCSPSTRLYSQLVSPPSRLHVDATPRRHTTSPQNARADKHDQHNQYDQYDQRDVPVVTQPVQKPERKEERQREGERRGRLRGEGKNE